MKRKTIRFVAVILMLAVILSTSAFAAGPGHDTTPGVFQMRILVAMVDNTNAFIERMVSFAQATPYDDVDWLLASISFAVAPVFFYAEIIGAEVVCVYEMYTIDGREVPIDPLIVIH